jgi:hypothetical protein
MTCSACESARGGENDPEALLDRVTDERALVLQIEIAGTSQTIALRQGDRSDQYQSAQRVGSGHPEQTTCERGSAIALIGKIIHSDSYIGSQCGPVDDLWPYPADNRTATAGSEEEQP